MSYILLAMNVLWFCFRNEAERRRLHGTPADCMRKFKALEDLKMLDEGLEIFLVPSRLEDVEQFEPWFYKNYSKLKYKTVHIGGDDQDFFSKKDELYEKFRILKSMMDRMESGAVVVHAAHFRNGRQSTGRFISETLPGVEIYVENSGFSDSWGHSIENLKDIFSDLPDYKLCLDICHIKDIEGYSLDDFIGDEDLRKRVAQIHYSYSTFLLDGDPYKKVGYPGYGPYHALFSVLGISPSERTRDFVREFPVILEGVLPREDKGGSFLKKEVELLRKVHG